MITNNDDDDDDDDDDFDDDDSGNDVIEPDHAALSICKAGRCSGLRCIGKSFLVGPSPCHKGDAHNDHKDDGHDDDGDDDDWVMVLLPLARNAANLLPNDPLNTLPNDDDVDNIQKRKRLISEVNKGNLFRKRKERLDA